MNKKTFFIVLCCLAQTTFVRASWLDISKKGKPTKEDEGPDSPYATMSRILTNMPRATSQPLYMLDRGARTIKDVFNVDANDKGGCTFKCPFKEDQGTIACLVNIFPDGKNRNILAL